MRKGESVIRTIGAILLLAVAAALCGVWVFGWRLPEHAMSFRDEAAAGWIVLAACGAVLTALLALALLFAPLLAKREKKNYVLQQIGPDSVSVSIDTVEQLASRCVREHSELQRPRVSVKDGTGGVSVEVTCDLRSGTDLRVSADYLQRQIRRHIADATGLKVESVSVRVDHLTGNAPKIADVPSHEKPIRPGEKDGTDEQSSGGDRS